MVDLTNCSLTVAILFRQNLYKNVPGPTPLYMKVPSYAISLYQQTLHQVKSSSKCNCDDCCVVLLTGQVHSSLLPSSPFMESKASRERTREWVALASPFACFSRVISRDPIKWKACSQARFVSGRVTRPHNEKTAQRCHTTEALLVLFRGTWFTIN